jgi:ferredoxin
MPKIVVEGRGTYEIAEGQKLVLGLEDGGVDMLHRCGGNARCTTCRVEVIEGDAGPMNEAERAKLEEKGFLDQFRLSCQVRVTGDLKVRPAMTAASSGLDPGPRPVD